MIRKNSFDNYRKAFDEIINLTVKPIPEKKKILSTSSVTSTSINLAIDLILKYLTYFLNPIDSVSYDVTVTKNGTVIRIIRDSLEYIINPNIQYSKIYNKNDRSINCTDYLDLKLFWINLICDDIINPMIGNNAKNINKKSLKILLEKLFFCQKDTDIITEDLFNILNNVSVKNFDNVCNVINPSFHHVYSKHKHFATQADLIINNTLLDIKNTKEVNFTKDYFRQLIYYYLWNSLEIDEYMHRFNVGGGISTCCIEKINIKTLEIYFPRFNYMFSFNVDEIWKNKNYQEKAKQIFISALKMNY